MIIQWHAAMEWQYIAFRCLMNGFIRLSDLYFRYYLQPVRQVWRTAEYKCIYKFRSAIILFCCASAIFPARYIKRKHFCCTYHTF